MVCITYFCDGRGFAEHQSKTLMTIEPLGLFDSNLIYLCIEHCLATGMQNGDEAAVYILLLVL